ncbi:MAG: tetratricopeptide repeat protein, partial [Planctomycetota bacterium]
MFARMRISVSIICGWAILVTMGCSSLKDQKLGANEQKPISKVPRSDSSKFDSKGNREILPETHFAAGRLHENNGHLSRAVEQYRMSISLDPKNIEAHNRLGIVLDRLRRFKEADDAFKRAIELAPDQAYLRNNLAFGYIMQQRWSEAETELTKALEMYPDFIRARVNLAMVLARQDRFEDAMDQFRTALPADDAYYNMGLMYQSKRKLVEAARAYKSALESNPKMVAAQKRLDKMPDEVLEEAENYTDMMASPPPVNVDEVSAADASDRPSTQPADDRSNSKLDDYMDSVLSALDDYWDSEPNTLDDSLDDSGLSTLDDYWDGELSILDDYWDGELSILDDNWYTELED